MVPDRWQLIERLYDSALEQPEADRAAFLKRACHGDDDLGREVASLLAQQTPAANFMEVPAIHMIAGVGDAATRPGEASPDLIGRTFAHYRVLEQLGGGGMGIVYKAEDVRLGRTVALKFLPERLTRDRDVLERFRREARAASSLNHPNICSVFDVGEQDGRPFIVMELLEGQTLRHLINAQPMPTWHVLALGIEIVGALEAAHAKGIVHRDIKPANIFVTGLNQAKILDFGLAKLAADAEPITLETVSATSAMTGEHALTEVGIALGTRSYMSPEQAQGAPIDARSDLFSFGAVLYEMATGTRAFQTWLDWTRPPTTPTLDRELYRIVLKLLDPNRDLRYQAASEVLADLKRLKHTIESRHTVRQRWMIAAAVLPIAGALVLASTWLRSNPLPISPDRWVRLTNLPDSVSQPALSPDGRMVAFIRGPQTFMTSGQVYVKILPDGEPVQLTRDDSSKMSPAFSPDGSRIAYTASPGVGWGDTWVVPVIGGGEPRPLLTNATGLAWLGSNRVLFSEVKDNDIHMGLVESEENRASARNVYVPSSNRGMAHRSYVSPDGNWALLVEMDRGPFLPCRLVPMNGRSPGRQVGPPDAGCTSAGWSRDGKWMFVNSSAGGTFHIWRQRFPDGEPEQMTAGLTEEEGITIAPDGRSLITAVGQRQSVVWTDTAAGERQVSLEGLSYDPKFTPDGKSLAYRVFRGTLDSRAPSELRIALLESGRSEPLLPGLEIRGLPGRGYDVSRDGRWLVASATDRDGTSRLWVSPLDRGSPPRPIPEVVGDTPLFGPDGEIYFRSTEGSSSFVYRTDQDGRHRRKALEQEVYGLLAVSPDGHWIVARIVGQGDGTTKAISLRDGRSFAIFDFQDTHFKWSSNRLLISIPESPGGSYAIAGKTYVVPLAAGQAFPPIPSGGFRSEAEIAAIPGTTVIDAYDAAAGPTPNVYAYSRQTVQRNLYRIPIP